MISNLIAKTAWTFRLFAVRFSIPHFFNLLFSFVLFYWIVYLLDITKMSLKFTSPFRSIYIYIYTQFYLCVFVCSSVLYLDICLYRISIWSLKLYIWVVAASYHMWLHMKMGFCDTNLYMDISMSKIHCTSRKRNQGVLIECKIFPVLD